MQHFIERRPVLAFIGAASALALATTAVALGTLGPRQMAAVAAPVGSEDCYLPDDLPAVEAGIRGEREALLAIRPRQAEAVNSMLASIAALDAERASTTAGIARLRALSGTHGGADGAARRVANLEARLSFLSGKATLTIVERRDRAALPAQIDAARAEAAAIAEAAPTLAAAESAWQAREPQLASLRAALEENHREAQAALAETDAAVAAADRSVAAARKNVCKCLDDEQAANLAAYADIAADFPAYITRRERELADARRDLPAAEKALRAARATSTKATPAAIEAASSTRAAKLRAHEAAQSAPRGSALWNGRQAARAAYEAANRDYLSLTQAQTVLEREERRAESRRATIADAPGEIARWKRGLQTAKTELPKLRRTSAAANGTLCSSIEAAYAARAAAELAASAEPAAGPGVAPTPIGASTGGATFVSAGSGDVSCEGGAADAPIELGPRVAPDGEAVIDLTSIEDYGSPGAGAVDVTSSRNCGDPNCPGDDPNHPNCRRHDPCAGQVADLQHAVDELDAKMQNLESQIDAWVRNQSEWQSYQSAVAESLWATPSSGYENPVGEIWDASQETGAAQSAIDALCDEREALDDSIHDAVQDYNRVNVECPQLMLKDPVLNHIPCPIRRKSNTLVNRALELP